ncbi:MAG TPA: GHMP kinase [Planctomycetota bacterium]
MVSPYAREERVEAHRVKYFEASKAPAEGLGVLALFQLIEEAVPAFFRADRQICINRAPGRLDVMGGFADTSGSLVLQLPTAEAACAAAQLRDDDLMRLWSPCGDGSRTQLLSMRLSDLGLPGHAIDLSEARALFGADARDRWAGYLLGGVLVLARERGLQPHQGFDLLVHSDVPEGIGVGSSSAVAVAAMCALADAYGLALSGRELALSCQLVETAVVGRPAGAKDPMTAACAQPDQLLALRCQPCELEGSIAVPEALEIVGLDSGAISVLANDQGFVRVGAGLGARMVSGDPAWSGHLADFPLGTFRARWQSALPETITGAQFLAQHGAHADPSLHVDPLRTYAVRAPTLHAIEESARVDQFAQLLQQEPTAERRVQLGELMRASHEAQVACGLGNPTMDFLVAQARERMAASGHIVGAKGTGNGGTLVLLGERGKVWYEALRIKKALLQQTGYSGHIFRWSSPGALTYGSIALTPIDAS